MKNIAIVAHKYLPQPDDDLVSFLRIKKKDNILHIKHSFSEAKDRRSTAEWYKNGRVFRRFESPDFAKFSEIIVYPKELIYTLFWVLKTRQKWNFYIAMDGLCTLFGIILRKLGGVGEVIYWCADFVPQNRFKSRWKNKIYELVNTLSVKHADRVWDLSPRMVKGRKKFLNIKRKDYKKHQVVPYGVWFDKIKRFDYARSEKSTLVFMGHLMDKQGVDIVIKQIPEVIRRIPNFRFKIIGGGSYKEDLTELAKSLKVERYCKFLGLLPNDRMLREIAKSAVAVAPYKDKLDNYTRYADPGKVKTYLACGVPVILTAIPWNAKEIEKEKCGVIMKNDGTDLMGKIAYLMNPKINRKFRNSAINYSKKNNYEEIFSNLNL